MCVCVWLAGCVLKTVPLYGQKHFDAEEARIAHFPDAFVGRVEKTYKVWLWAADASGKRVLFFCEIV